MTEKKVTIQNETGIHARPATMVVQLANKFKSEVNIEKNGTKAVAKSMLNILALGIQQGDEIIVSAQGEDEKEAVEAMVDLIENGLDEA